MKKYIEEQPRGLSAEAVRLKVNEIIEKTNAHHERIATLEAAKTSADNEDIKRALMDAHNAIEQAISFFKLTAEENKK